MKNFINRALKNEFTTTDIIVIVPVVMAVMFVVVAVFGRGNRF